jgi:hypothetical protein
LCPVPFVIFIWCYWARRNCMTNWRANHAAMGSTTWSLAPSAFLN